MISLWPSRMVQITPLQPPVMPSIVAIVAAEHGLTKEDLIGPNRTKPFAIARFHAMWECRQHPHLSLQQIGRYFGNRDHTTVINAVQRHQQAMQSPGEYYRKRRSCSPRMEYAASHG